MSGFTDEFYKATTALFQEKYQVASPPRYYSCRERPDVWFEPAQVWEVRGADLTISPVHTAAAGMVKNGPKDEEVRPFVLESNGECSQLIINAFFRCVG
jgi:ATP-dependent DNA ligase